MVKIGIIKETKTPVDNRVALTPREIVKIQEKYPNIDVNVQVIKNVFFGEAITVSGLITGQDLKAQLKEQVQGDYVFIPCNMLRSGENVFLDDVTVEETANEINKDIVVVDEGGYAFVQSILNPTEHRKMRRRQIYEQTSSSYSGQA